MNFCSQLKQPRLLLLILTNLLILVSLIGLLKPSWRIGSDGYGYYSYLRSLAFDKNFDFSNEYQQFDQLYQAKMSLNITPLNKTGNYFSIGPSILWTPFFLIGQTLNNLKPALDEYQLPGFNYPYQIAIALGTIVYFFIGLSLLYLGLKKFFSDNLAFGVTSAIWLVSPLAYYLIYEPSMSHALSFFAVNGLFYNFCKYYKQTSGKAMIIMGLWLGMAMLIYWQNSLFIILPLYLIFRNNPGWLEKFKSLASLGATAMIMFLPQLLMWHYLYGSYLTIPQGANFFNLSSPHLGKYLFSGYHGLFAWHPLLVFSLIGLLGYLKINKKFIIVISLALVLQLYLNSILTDWMGGGAFGSRRIIGALFIFAFGLAALFLTIKNKMVKACLHAIIILTIGWNALLMISCSRGIIPVNKPITVNQLINGQLETANLLYHKIVPFY